MNDDQCEIAQHILRQDIRSDGAPWRISDLGIVFFNLFVNCGL
jgi:hypothetical protein